MVKPVLLYNKSMGKVTPTKIQRFVVKHLAVGDTRDEIVAKVKKEYNFDLHAMTVYAIGKRRHEEVNTIRAAILKETATTAAQLKTKANNLIGRKLDKATADFDEIQKIRQEFRNGFITKHEYDIQMKTLETMTVGELAQISKEASTQVKAEDPNEPTAQDAATLALMLEAIRSGNPINIIQAVNSPTPSSQSPAPSGQLPPLP